MFYSKQIYKNLQTKGEQISANLQILCLSFSVERERPKETFQLKEEEKKRKEDNERDSVWEVWDGVRKEEKEKKRGS